MHITLRLYGNLRRYAPGGTDRAALELADGLTIRALLQSLGVPENDWWMSAVNDRVVDADSVLHEGELVEIFEPVGGGGFT